MLKKLAEAPVSWLSTVDVEQEVPYCCSPAPRSGTGSKEVLSKYYWLADQTQEQSNNELPVYIPVYILFSRKETP